MNKTKLASSILYLIIFMLSMVSAYALNDMPNSLISSDDQAYVSSGRSLINSQDYPAIVYSLNALGISQKIPPLFYDVNGDGINEILVVVGTSVNIYNFVPGSGLIYNQTISTNFTKIYNMKIYNYNGAVRSLISGIITYGYVQERVWNSTSNSFNSVGITNHYFGTLTGDTPNVFACDSITGNCVIEAAFGESVSAFSFKLDNTTPYISSVTGYSWGSSGNTRTCRNSIPDMSIGDTNGDGVNEFAATHIQIPTFASSYYHTALLVYSISSSNVLTVKSAISDNIAHVTYNNCAPFLYLFSSPIIMDTIDNGAQKEMVFASTPSTAGQFKQYVYKYTLSSGSYAEYSHHPNVDSAEGYVVSNPVRARVFDNYAPNNANDFCTMGVSSGNATMITCGSNKGAYTFLGITTLTAFNFFDSNNSAVWTPSDTNAQNYLYSIYASNSYYNDFITPYGLISIGGHRGIFSDTIGNFNAQNFYSVNYGNGIMFPAFGNNDAEDGLFDYGFVTNSSFLYIDDAFVNLNAKIDAYCINPNPASVWRTNTTLQVIITPVDAENNNVRAEAILYAGATFEKDSGVSADFPSGTQITFNFLVNQSINNGVLTLKAQDNKAEHNSSFDTISIPISVSDSGTVVYGDNQLCVSGLIAQNAAAAALKQSTSANPYTNTNNSLKKGIDDIALIAGLPTSLFILILMFVGDLVIFGIVFFMARKENSHINPTMILFALIFFDFLGLMIATLMGLFSAPLFITFIVCLLIIGALYLGNVINKKSGG